MTADLQEQNCPSCDHKINAASKYDESNAIPSKGEFTVCVYCKSLFVFNDDLSMRPINEKDMDELGEGGLLALQKTMEKIDEMRTKIETQNTFERELYEILDNVIGEVFDMTETHSFCLDNPEERTLLKEHILEKIMKGLADGFQSP